VLKPAIFARFILRINSSVFPENIDPQITSIQPFLDVREYFGSINMEVKIHYLLKYHGVYMLFDGFDLKLSAQKTN
jgi:hypothetical protein